MITSAALVFTVLATSPVADIQKVNETDRARALVKQLGDRNFKVRDAAERELIELGTASLDALKEGEQSTDVHVIDRCRALQPMIRELTLRRRIDDFIANRGEVNPKDLPLAETFLKSTGDTKEARTLFADVLTRHSSLLDLIARDKKKGLDQFTTYCQEVAQRMQFVRGVDPMAQRMNITQSDVSMYMLIAIELSADKTGRVASNAYPFLQAPSLKATLAKDTPENLPFKKLFMVWLEKEPQPHMVHQALQIAVDVKMKEAVPILLNAVKNKTTPIYSRAQTALLLAKVGEKEHLKEIEPLLEDKTVVGNFGVNNKQGTVQMRDVALAVSIKLNGQKMADYDFDVMQGSDENLYQSYIYCAFSSSEKRDAAHAKFKEWKAKQEKK